MLSLVLAIAIGGVCPAPIIVSDKPLTKVDLAALRAAKKGCRRHYPKSPCVKVFKVIKQHSYQVICSGTR